MKRIEIWIVASVFVAAGCSSAGAQAKVEFTRAFAPSDGMVAEVEKPLRDEMCLNGSWQFQPMPMPADYKKGTGHAAGFVAAFSG